MSYNNFKVDFFRNENIGNPPAVSTRRVTAQKVLSATLNWSLNFDLGVAFDGIKFNGASLGNRKIGSADVTAYIVINGNNDVKLDYSRWLDPFGKAGVATVSLDVVAVGVGQHEPAKTVDWDSYKWWLVGAGVVVVLILLAWFLFKTSAGGSIVKGVTNVVKGAI